MRTHQTHTSAHRETLDAAEGMRLGLAGHAWFETYSVLRRLLPGSRRSPVAVRAILEHDFPGTRHLDSEAAVSLRSELAELGIAGGAVYDPLVGATARAHDVTLLSRDRRARAIYDSLRVRVRFIG